MISSAMRIAWSVSDRATAHLLLVMTTGHHDDMNGRRALKQRLPYPFNQDLSQVLHHLNRRTAFGRQEAANDPVTAAYLAAGMRLVSMHVGPAEKTEEAVGLDEGSVDRSVLGFLSQRAVAAEMANNPEPFPRCGNVSTMRSTWKSQSDYIADLLSFAFSPGYYPESYQEVRAFGAETLAGDGPFAEEVEDLAYRVMQAIEEMVSFRLQLIASACAERSEVTRQALEAKYHRAHCQWKQVYAECLEARGLRLRPGMTLDQLTAILTSVVEGAMLREIGDPTAEIRDPVERRSLLGTAALALLNGCLEPTGEPDGRSVAQALEAMVVRSRCCGPDRLTTPDAALLPAHPAHMHMQQ